MSSNHHHHHHHHHHLLLPPPPPPPPPQTSPAPLCLPTPTTKPKPATIEPFFEYINTMLMDETISDDVEHCCTSWPLQQSFLNIFNGFHEILGQPDSSAPAPPARAHESGWDQSTISTTARSVSNYSNNGECRLPDADNQEVEEIRVDSNGLALLKNRGPGFVHDSNFRYVDGAISTTIVYSPRRGPPVTDNFSLQYESQGMMNISCSSGLLGNTNSGLYAGLSRCNKSDAAVQASTHVTGEQIGEGIIMRRPNGRRYPWEVNKSNGRGGSGRHRAAGRWRPRTTASYSSLSGGVTDSWNPAAAEAAGGGVCEDEEVSFVQNEYLRAEALANLHDSGWTPCSSASSDPNARSSDMRAAVGGGGGGGGDDALNNPVDLRAVLLRCARVMADGDVKKANQLLSEVQQNGASPQGSGLQRVAFYFSEALQARMNGTGASLMYSASILPPSKQPSVTEVLKAYKRVEFEACPYIKLTNYFANQHILDAAKGASRLHIVDYGISYGFQWPCLISALAQRKGGPPFLKITGIDLPASAMGRSPAEVVEQTGRRLARYARAYGVPFQYHGVAAATWEDINAEVVLGLSGGSRGAGEVLAINTINRLRHLLDESAAEATKYGSEEQVAGGRENHHYHYQNRNRRGGHEMAAEEAQEEEEEEEEEEGYFKCPRDKVLAMMRRLQPDIVVMGFVNGAHSSPFFVPRFKEALYYYASRFDALHSNVAGEVAERAMVEREVLGREIMNVVACEGAERVERPETYKKWHARIQRTTGFTPLPLPPPLLATSRAIVESLFHKEFSVFPGGHGHGHGHDANASWMLMGWKGRPVQALSAWKPTSSSSS